MESFSRFVYVGDYGNTTISDKTIYAWGVLFLKNADRNWKKSKTKRAKAEEFFRALGAIQKYHWLRGEEIKEF